MSYLISLEAAAKREAQEQAKKEAAAKRQAVEEERKRNAEARKQIEFDRYQRQMEIDKQKRQQVSKPKQKSEPPKKEVAATQAKPSPTFSLFGLGGGTSASEKEESAPTANSTPPVAAKKGLTAPRGVPTLNKWTLNSDNTISGFISGSSSFKDGSPVTTSSITGKAASGSVVQTKSKSKYFLGEEGSGEAASSGGGLFGGLFGGGGSGEKPTSPAPVAKSLPVKKSSPVKKAAPIKQVKDTAAERKKIAEQAALEKKRRAEEIAAEKQRKAEEAKAAAEAKRQAQEQKKKEAEEKRRIAAEGKFVYML